MPLIQAIILALVQALTEFLPVSSTAHLVLFPWLMHWPDPGEAFDVALHAGTLLAVILYFFKDWLTLLVCGLGGSYPKSAPAEEIEQHRRTPAIIGVSLILVALLMWWADSRATLARKLEQSNWGDAIGIGVAQA